MEVDRELCQIDVSVGKHSDVSGARNLYAENAACSEPRAASRCWAQHIEVVRHSRMSPALLPSASFDFETYLQDIDPSSSYKITTLDGGIINVTARATRVASRSLEGANSHFSAYNSVILKHAPPFVAKVASSAVGRRQVNRAAILRHNLFTPREAFNRSLKPKLSTSSPIHGDQRHRARKHKSTRAPLAV